jgi:hypothetical protein
MKWTIAKGHRSAIGRLFEGVLGAKKLTPMPQMDVFSLGDGCNVGVMFVDDAEALPDDVQQRAAWLEFLVPDVDDAVKQLDAAGLRRVAYEDSKHAYFHAPGGPVFRVAAQA